MTRVAIYARYSDVLQRDASIEDQIRVCQERAEREGWRVVNCYTDHAISGSSMIRPGIQQLMTDAAAGLFDIVLTESLDRLSRDQEDTAGLYKRLCFFDLKIITLSEGEITSLHIGFKGTMNELYLKDMADKVRRGQRGRVEQGKAGGGNCYGYDVVKKLDERGEPIRGERAINEAQARIVRRIFEEYANGKAPKAIAADLNNEGVPGPSGKGWSPSTINGNWQRGAGILNNELYNGVIAWNKVRYIKNPDTGKHVTRNNPPEEWVRKEVPELRIVDAKIWDRAKARQKRGRIEKPEFWQRQRPKYLFSHLLKCGECGGGFSKISRTHLGCSTVRNKGESLCTNRRTISKDDLERTVLAVLQENLMDPELVEAFCGDYTQHINRLRKEHNASLHAYRAELDSLKRKDKRMVQAIMDGFASESLKVEMDALVARKKELEALLAGQEEVPVRFHPFMAKRYRDEVRALVEALSDEEHRHEAVDLIRGLVERIVLVPDPEGPGLLVDVYGDLAGILNTALKGDGYEPEREFDIKQIRLVVGMNAHQPLGEQVKMVGPAGFEPATTPL